MLKLALLIIVNVIRTDLITIKCKVNQKKWECTDGKQGFEQNSNTCSGD